MVIFKIARRYEQWYHSHHILSIDPFDMKSMSIKFDNDILTSFSQAFEIEITIIGYLIYVGNYVPI